MDTIRKELDEIIQQLNIHQKVVDGVYKTSKEINGSTSNLINA